MSSPIALYGSLLSGLPSEERPKIEGLLEFVGPCIIPGQLIDLGSYPGLVESETDFVRGEFYNLLDPQALQILDLFERYDPQSPDDSLYHRRLVFLKQPPLQA
jgi:gamma-glutamylcyclotransferase (GGCT)/AIG2-like uncharacterized protein YtfP